MTKQHIVTANRTCIHDDDKKPYAIKDKTYNVTFACSAMNTYGIFSENKEEHCISEGSQDFTSLESRCYISDRYKSKSKIIPILNCKNCKLK